MPHQKNEAVNGKPMTIDDLAKKMDASFENLGEMINTSFSDMESRVANIGSRMATKSSLKRLEKKVDDLGSRMNGVEYEVGELRDSIEKVTLPRVRRIERHLHLGELAPASGK